MTTQGLLDWLDERCATAGDCHDASEAIRQRTNGIMGPELGALCRGLDYMRRWPEVEDGEVFGPQSSYGAHRYPEPLADTSEETLGVWAEAAGRCRNVVLRGRLAHLLWERRYGQAHEWAQRAIDAYLESTDASAPDLMEKSDNLCHALDIALRLKDKGRSEAVIRASVDLIDESLAVEEPMPGPGLSLAKMLSNASSVGKEVLLAKCQAMLTAFPDPHNQQSILELIGSLAGDGPTRTEARTASVRTWLAAGDEASGLVRSAHYERALELAHAYNLPELAREALLRLETSSSTDDMQTISASVEIPRDAVERRIDAFVGDDSWTAALMRLGSVWPIGDDRQDAESFIRTMMAEHPLQFLFSRMVLDDDGVPMYTVKTEDDHFTYALAEHEARLIGFWSLTVEEVLARVFAKWDVPEGELEQHFQSLVIPDDAARAFELAFRHYLNADYESALMVVLPRIEECLRHWCGIAGLPTRERDRFGNIRRLTLGALIPNLAQLVGESYPRYLALILTDQMAFNLRNNALHGLIPTVSKGQAALALHVALTLRLWVAEPEEGQSP